jgi:hypothetical protein
MATEKALAERPAKKAPPADFFRSMLVDPEVLEPTSGMTGTMPDPHFDTRRDEPPGRRLPGVTESGDTARRARAASAMQQSLGNARANRMLGPEGISRPEPAQTPESPQPVGDGAAGMPAVAAGPLVPTAPPSAEVPGASATTIETTSVTTAETASSRSVTSSRGPRTMESDGRGVAPASRPPGEPEEARGPAVAGESLAAAAMSPPLAAGQEPHGLSPGDLAGSRGPEPASAGVRHDSKPTASLSTAAPPERGRPGAEGPSADRVVQEPGIAGETLAAGPPGSMAHSAEFSDHPFVRQISQIADQEKVELRREAQTQRATIAAQVEASVQAVVDQTQTKVRRAEAEAEARKAETLRAFATAHGALLNQMEIQKAAARAHRDASLAELKQAVDARRKAALDASETKAKELEAAGLAEANRARASSGESAKRVQALTTQVSGQDPKVQAVVRSAVSKTASDLAVKIAQNGESAGRTAEDSARSAAADLRHSGATLAGGVGKNAGEVEKVIHRAAEAALHRVSAVAMQHLNALETMKSRTLTAHEKSKSAAVSGTMQTGRAAVAATRRAGQARLHQVDRFEAASLLQLDEGASRAANLVTGARSPAQAGPARNGPGNGGPARNGRGPAESPRAAPDTTQEAASAVGEKFRQARLEMAGALTELADENKAVLDSIGHTHASEVAAAQGKVEAAGRQASSAVAAGIGQVRQGAARGFQDSLAESRGTQQKAIQVFGSQLDQDIGRVDGALAKDKERSLGEIRSKVDACLKGNAEIEQRAPAALAKVAADAADKAKGSILSGIWEGFLDVLEGLGKFLLVAAIVLVVLVVGFGMALSWPLVLGVLAATGLAFLIVGFIQAVDRRIDEILPEMPPDSPWWAYLLAGFAIEFVALGDVLGITPIIEGITNKSLLTGKSLHLTPEQRARMITAGVLSLALMALLHLLFKGKGATEEPGRGGEPGEDPIRPVLDPWAALAAKYGLRPDIVKMMRGSGIGPEIFDRLLGRGVDAETAALVADGHGVNGIRVLDALTRDGITTQQAEHMIQDSHSLGDGNLATMAELAERGVLARMIRRGFDSTELPLLVDELGPKGIEIIDRLMTDNVQKNPAIEVARIARQVGALDDVHQLVTSGNIENPLGLRNFMRQVADEVANGQGGKLAQLREAARRSAGGRVALEKSTEHQGEADVIDHARREALQIKEVTSDKPDKVAENLDKAAKQLRGETGEKPPEGYRTIDDVRVTNPNNPMFPLDRAQLLQALRAEGITKTGLSGVDEVHVTNGTGTHVFQPAEF